MIPDHEPTRRFVGIRISCYNVLKTLKGGMQMKKMLLVMLMVTFAVISLNAQTINVLAADDDLTRAVREMIPEFQRVTGIQVNFELVPSYNMLEMTSLGVSENRTSYDLVMVDEGNIAMFARLMSSYDDWPEGKHFQKLRGDEVPRPIFEAALWAGDIKGMPINANLYVWMTRQDLIDDPRNRTAFRQAHGYDLKIPETLDELLEIGTFFHQRGIAGFAPFTKSTEGSTCEAIFMFESYGTNVLDFVDGKFEVILDKQKAVDAINFYKKLLAISPEGALDFGHAERITEFSFGDVFAMFIWPAQIPNGIENPLNSDVAGMVHYGAPPSGPARRAAIRGVWTLTIPNASNNKAAAAEFAYWWGSYEAGKEKLVAAGMTPARNDLLLDEELGETRPWFKGMFESMQHAVSRPRFERYPEVSNRIMVNWLDAVSGRVSPEEAVDKMIQEVKDVLARYGY